MYVNPHEMQKAENVARNLQAQRRNVARRVIMDARVKGKPLPDGFAARYPHLVGQLGDPDPQQIDLPDLGLAFALPALASSLASKVPVVGGLFKPSTQGLNPQRAQANTDLANRARAGDVAAWDQLSARSKPGALPYDMWKDAAQKLAGIPRPTGVPVAPSINVVAAPASPVSTTSQPVVKPKPSGPPSWLNTIIDSIQGQQPGGAAQAAPAAPVYSGGGGGPSYTPDPAATAAGPAAPSGGISPVVLIGGAVLAALVLGGTSSRRSLL